jgi:hypothetical protein
MILYMYIYTYACTYTHSLTHSLTHSPTHSPYTYRPAAEWTLASLRQRVGEVTVSLRKGTDTEGYRSGKVIHQEKMEVSEYFDMVIASDEDQKVGSQKVDIHAHLYVYVCVYCMKAGL